MKVLVFSDVHGHKERLEAILKAHEDAKYIISLGDSELKQAFLQKYDIIAIKGNFPFDSGFTHEHTMAITGRQLYLSHGHKTKVKYGYETLYHKMLEHDADLALHGHTHVMSLTNIAGKYIINPGALHRPRGMEGATYCILTFEEDHVKATWLDAESHEPVKQQSLDI